MKKLTKLKIRRFLNRRSNGVVEQLEKLLSKLQAWIEKLDAEQDAANAAMQAEIRQIRDDANAEVERLQNQIEAAKQAAQDAELSTREDFTTIIDESRREAERAKQVQHNMKVLAGVPN